MSTQDSHFTVRHDGVAIEVSRGGRGRPLVLCPGLLTTQADLRELIGLLRRDHEVVTFDLRGHGLSSSADRYTFEAFLGDFGAVMAESGYRAPLLVGHSLGADLAVHYAAARPDAVSGLVLVDGANPVPEPFLTEADLPEFRAMAEGLRHEFERLAGTARQVLLAPQDFLDLNVEIEAVRSGILDRYRKIGCPIHLIMSTSMAGTGDDERTRWRNENWRAGVERLVRERPHLSTSWLDADHGLVVTHAPEIARLIRDAAKATF
ncbi:alpha/beta hydrolase [Amycolatopsis sp. WAC 04182]|uniref:alpha/beta fold hydrolase n=1 Tax=Amycolatopsis sp. WAC 04182 TaxID=2203198 RepID=UPI000F7A1334|nr:alpha/beta fold hydrolase [Amycolatopsis sp. WAC 04182]RSN54378.1 alpha/beta hydrolase [Amycolatopsis sp. WAC 04182]